MQERIKIDWLVRTIKEMRDKSGCKKEIDENN
jgi:hypothetical protein